MTIRLYGITNCDTVKRARAWLAERGQTPEFHDYKKAGVPAERLDAWFAMLGWELLVNRKGTTWRALPPAERDAVIDAATARAALLAHPSAIRRPVVEWGDGCTTVGFDPQDWARRMG